MIQESYDYLAGLQNLESRVTKHKINIAFKFFYYHIMKTTYNMYTTYIITIYTIQLYIFHNS